MAVFNAGYFHDYLLLRFVPSAQWFSVTPLGGSLGQGESAILTAWLRSADLDTGLFYYDVEVHSNDPDPGDNPWIVPVTLQVTDCTCPYQGDFDEDSYITALDLANFVDVLYSGAPDVQDPTCDAPRGDFECDGYSTSLDLGVLIDHLFVGGDGPCDPCAP